jgi:hypothetical protein
MSFRIEGPVSGHKLVQFSVRTPELSPLDTLEHHPDQHIARIRIPGVKLELTGDAYVRFMQSLTQSHLQLERASQHEVQLYIQLLLPVESAPNSSLTPESPGSFTSSRTGTVADYDC